MKYPFKKASFWIIFMVLFASTLIGGLPRITPEWYRRAQHEVSKLAEKEHWSDWPSDPYYSHFPIDWERIISYMAVIFLIDYFGHLIYDGLVKSKQVTFIQKR